MPDLREKSEIEYMYNRCFGIREEILKPWSQIMNAIINQKDEDTARRYTEDIRDSVERWIASSSGTVRAMAWTIGKESFINALSPMLPDFVNGLRLNWWKEEYATPEGPLPSKLTAETYPNRRLQDAETVLFLYKHAVGIHSHIYNINKLHPGNWHPEFQNRVINTLLFYEGAIRFFGWALKRRPHGEAFYAFADQVIDQLKAALDARRPLEIGILPVDRALPAMDHKRSDFGE